MPEKEYKTELLLYLTNILITWERGRGEEKHIVIPRVISLLGWSNSLQATKSFVHCNKAHICLA